MICGEQPLAHLGVGDAEALLGREHEHAELALVQVVVHLVRPPRRPRSNGNTADSIGWILPSPIEPVRLPRLAVVREVTALERLLVHPEVAVVVLDHEAAGGRAGDDRPAARAHEHRRAHRRTARVLEHDVGIGADELADPLAEAAPLGRVLRVLVLPELVALGLAVDDVLDAHARAAARRARADDTTPTGVPPPFSTYWHAYAPMPPLAPQISTVWPCVICAPFGLTSMR